MDEGLNHGCIKTSRRITIPTWETRILKGKEIQGKMEWMNSCNEVSKYTETRQNYRGEA